MSEVEATWLGIGAGAAFCALCSLPLVWRKLRQRRAIKRVLKGKRYFA